MNKRIILILGLFFTIVAVFWFDHFRGSRKHETGNSGSTFRIAPFDQRSKAFVLERDATWFAVDRDYSALSGLMQATGMVPSVRRLTNLLTSSSPGYRRWKLYWWLFPRRATLANALANMKEGYLELATLDDTNATPTLRVSDDGHLGLLWLGTNAVMVFQDVTNGLQQTQYREKANATNSGGLSAEGNPLAGSSDAATRSPPASANSEAVKAEIAKLQGVWLMVSGADGGKPPAPVSQIYQGEKATTTLAGRPYLKEKIIVDSSRTPKTIDFEMANGSGKSIKKLGIYQLDGDSLRLCIANPGDDRPTTFSRRKEEGGGALSVWKRKGVGPKH